jgi:2-polyprenyl-6-methoxyphenol hydroxylase-like FAD-dependent oxidoreductase
MTPDVAAETCIFGGGPAGAVVARRLAELGHDTLLIDRADQDGPARGESLAPSILPILESLQLRAEVEAAAFGREQRALVLWASSAFEEKEFAGAPALLIERTQFDKRLRRAAMRAGVRLMPAARARAPRRLPSGGWAIPVATAEGTTLVTASFLWTRAASAVAAARRMARHGRQRSRRRGRRRIVSSSRHGSRPGPTPGSGGAPCPAMPTPRRFFSMPSAWRA